MHRTEYGHTRIRYDSVYLTCSKKLTGSQLSPPHGSPPHGIILGHLWYVCYSRFVWYTIAFWYIDDISVFSTLGMVPSEFWYIWFTLVHLTFGTAVGTLQQLVH